MTSWIERKLHLRSRWNGYRSLASDLGLSSAVKYLVHNRLDPERHPVVWTHPRQAVHPLAIRCDTSDLSVFRQIFVRREYGCLDDLPDVRLVIDCGANVGYSSAYFLSRFPNCRVVAVEPDPGNFAMLQRNLSPYGGRVRLVRAGVWSHTVGLVMSQDPYRDGREWSKQVRLCRPGEEPDFEGVDIGSLLSASGCGRVSLLKMDIEGAEAVVFSDNYQPWLPSVDAIAVELHDDSCFGQASEVFYSAIGGPGFQVSRSGELTICRRPGLTARTG
jgi:FkbM family methyltransferase